MFLAEGFPDVEQKRMGSNASGGRRARPLSVLLACACVILFHSCRSSSTFAAELKTPLSEGALHVEENGGESSVGQVSDGFSGSLEVHDLTSRTPFILACCVFFLQLCCGILSLIVLVTRKNPTEDMNMVRDSMAAFVLIASVELAMYGMLASSPDIENSSWTLTFVDDRPYLICRNWAWLSLTPIQWYCFTRCCKAATLKVRARLILYTILVHVNGLLCMYTPSREWAQVAFVLSCMFFLMMFNEGFRLPVHRTSDPLSSAILKLELVCWALYPTVLVLRMTGHTSIWFEQVVAYTFLDVLAKTISFSGIIVAQLGTILDDINVKALNRQPSP